MTHALECTHLSKGIAGKTLLADFNFFVGRGEVLGVVGQNGAGKSVLFSCLLGLLSIDCGVVKILGVDVRTKPNEIYGVINFASSYHSLQLHSTPLENLLTYARLYAVPNPEMKIERLSSELRITDVVYSPKKMVALSSGQTSKVVLCKALVNDPKVLFLDEYSTFFDPIFKKHANSYLKSLNRLRKMTIIMATHQLDEVRNVCDRVLVISKGRVSYFGVVKPTGLLIRYM